MNTAGRRILENTDEKTWSVWPRGAILDFHFGKRALDIIDWWRYRPTRLKGSEFRRLEHAGYPSP